MTDVLDFIEHHGTKGMKWGVRNQKGKPSRADKKWQKNIYTLKGAIDVHNNVANKMNNGEIAKFNAKNVKPGHNYLNENHPETQKYYRAYEKLNAKLTEQAVKEVHGTSPSGGFKATIDKSGPDWKIVVVPVEKEVRHAKEIFPTITMELVVENGLIVMTKNVKEDLKQSMDLGEDFLEHYGVVGMRWGVSGGRKSRPKLSTDYKVTVPLRNRNTKELSNKQIQTVTGRINLEQNYTRLNPSKVKIGENIVKGVLATLGTAASIYTLAQSPAGKAGTAFVKKALKRKV